jgi:hypothetical protein
MSTSLLPKEILEVIFSFLQKDLCTTYNYEFTIKSIPKEYISYQEEKIIKKFKRWERVLKKDFLKNKYERKKIRTMCFEGIPPRLRNIIWYQLLNGKSIKSKETQKFTDLGLGTDSKWWDNICVDTQRTYSGSVFIKYNEKSLKNNLLKYTEIRPNVRFILKVKIEQTGYAGGMNFIMSLFLFNMPEERAFWSFVSFLDAPNSPMNFSKSQKCLHRELFVFEELTKKYIPSASSVTSVTFGFASNWITGCFSLFQPEVACRIMDVICIDGINAIHRVAIALMLLYEKEILKLSFEDGFLKLIELPSRFYDAEKLMKVGKCFFIDFSRKLIL